MKWLKKDELSGFDLANLEREELKNCELNLLRMRFGEFAEVQPLYSIYYDEREKVFYISNVSAAICFNGVWLFPHKKAWNCDSYGFHLVDYPTDKQSNDRRHTVSKKYPHPNYVGKPTAKKLQEWLDYLQAIETEVSSQLCVLKNTREQFLSTLPIEKIEWENSEQTRGHIARGAVKFNFRIYDTEVYTDLAIETYRQNKHSFAEFNAVADLLGYEC